MATSASMTAAFNLIGGDLAVSIGAPKLSFPCPSSFPHTIESAHKKGAGSTKNVRDSHEQRLGVKIYDDQAAKPGAIIVRQRGTEFHPGKNVGLGKDYIIFSLIINGLVKFEKISVYTQVKPEKTNSHRVGMREYFRLQRERNKA
ncbi:hypothetical protein SAY86_007337 [Trapa natans]|uniref:50S ribosomal protein L27, chloroplastic n=1 Tax=Trapa natans TaxID=22666 RepID=A0AAN7LH60_TRANT|nr:hypothetical protein SAY86_007337 [Trapa natans]